MSHLLLSCEKGSRRIIEWPPGLDPEVLAKQHGAKIYEPCASLEEAQRRLFKDPNGKPIWY
jgi:hypothetical protein